MLWISKSKPCDIQPSAKSLDTAAGQGNPGVQEPNHNQIKGEIFTKPMKKF